MGSIATAIALGAGLLTAVSGNLETHPQLTGDFSRSECRQALQLALALPGPSQFAPRAALSIPADFPSKPALFPKGPLSDAMDSDPAVFQVLDRPNFAARKLRHVYWQEAPYGKRLVIAQEMRENKNDQYLTYLLDAAVAKDNFLDVYGNSSSPPLFRPIANTGTPPHLLTDKMTGRVWELDRGQDAWGVFSLDEVWTNYRCSIEFGPAKKQTKPSWIDFVQRRPNEFCKAEKIEQRFLLCSTGLSEETRRENAWATLRDFKSNPKIDCRGLGDCSDLVAAFRARREIEFLEPLRSPSLLDPRFLKLLPAQMDSNLGRQLIEDGCDSRRAHFSRATGAVVVYEIASYKGSGQPALRMEFYGLRPEDTSGSEPDLRLVQIVDPVTGAVAASKYDTEDTLIDSGFFRYKSVSYRYQIFGAAGESYVSLAPGGPEDISSKTEIWVELK